MSVTLQPVAEQPRLHELKHRTPGGEPGGQPPGVRALLLEPDPPFEQALRPSPRTRSAGMAEARITCMGARPDIWDSLWLSEAGRETGVSRLVAPPEEVRSH